MVALAQGGSGLDVRTGRAKGNPTCYRIPRRWAFRHEPGCRPEFQLIDVCSGTRFEITQHLFLLLGAWSDSSFTLKDVLAWREKAGWTIRPSDIEAVLRACVHFGVIIAQRGSKLARQARSLPQLHTPLLVNGLNIPASPREAELHLTHGCNLRCLHCGYEAGRCRQGELDPATWIRVIDELEAMGTAALIISGGEPLLYRGGPDILAHLATKRMRVELLTNGTLIDQSTAELLAAPNLSTNISLDGADATTHDHLRGAGSFARTLQGLDLLAQENVPFHLEMTLHRENIAQIGAVAELAARLGATSLTLGVLYDVGRASSARDLLLAADDIERAGICVAETAANIPTLRISFVDPRHPVHRNLDEDKPTNLVYCPGGTARIAIRSDGAVFPCAYGFCNDRFRAGSVVEQSVMDVWRTGRWSLFRGFSAERLYRCDKCHLGGTCLLKICRLMAFASTGDFYSPPPGCEWLLRLAQKSKNSR